MSSPLKQNTITIQELLNTINSLPEAGGVDLPELANEGSASDLLSDKQLIDSDGNVITGTIQHFDGSYECSSESTGGRFRKQGVFTVTDKGMLEPEVNEYELYNDNLDTDNANCIIIYGVYSSGTVTTLLVCFKIESSDQWEVSATRVGECTSTATFEGTSMSIFGNLSGYDSIQFIQYI